MESLQDVYREYFNQHLNAENADELIPAVPRKFKVELETLLEQHQAKKVKEYELKSLVDPFMADLNKLLEQPHITRYDLSSMQKKARSISPECMAAAAKLLQMPVLA
ncbi:MAG: hypothetical protein KAI17_17275 [Thiotrichaceae bacterium]|nr:hypothetical protein [Thiotrichaceae bacterium]